MQIGRERWEGAQTVHLEEMQMIALSIKSWAASLKSGRAMLAQGC